MRQLKNHLKSNEKQVEITVKRTGGILIEQEPAATVTTFFLFLFSFSGESRFISGTQRAAFIIFSKYGRIVRLCVY